MSGSFEWELRVNKIADRIKSLADRDLVSLVSGSAFIFGLRTSGAIITYLTQILLARWIGAEELGIYVFALSGCVVLFLIATLGLPPAALRFVPQYEAKGNLGGAKGYFLRAQKIVLVASLAVAATALGVLLFLNEGRLDSTVLTRALAFCSIPFFALIATNTGIARSLSLMAIAVLPQQGLRQIGLLCAVVVGYFLLGGLSAPHVMAMLLTVVFVLALGQGLFLHRHFRNRFGQVTPHYETRLWLRTALPLLAVAGFTQGTMEANLFVAGIYLPPEELAVFNAAYRTSNFVNYGMVAITFMAAPRVSRLFFEEDPIGLQRIVTQQAHLRFLFAVCATAALLLLGERMLALFGEQFVEGYTALAILVAAHLFVGMTGPAVQILSISGNERRCALVFACALVGVVVANTLLVPLWGIEGAALAVLVVSMGWASWVYRLTVRRTGVDPSIFGSSLRHAIAHSEQPSSPWMQLSKGDLASVWTGSKSCISRTLWGHATTHAAHPQQISVETISS
jgi:O-antigen/teichoic acid export membrane protein